MKHLEDTPWWICDPEDTNYVAYSDTDSMFEIKYPSTDIKVRTKTQ